MDYVIEEVFEIVCDVDKLLSVKFRLDGDGDDYYRQIVDSDYYDWCYEKFLTEEEDSYEDDEDEYFSDRFSVDSWNMNYCNEETVIEFLYEAYPNIKQLPSPQI